MTRFILVLAVHVAWLNSLTSAQTPTPGIEKKTEPGKSKDEPGKSKGKDTGKPKLPLDRAKLPKDAIVIILDDILDALGLFPKAVVMSFEEYTELREKLKALERQLKSDRKLPFSCKLLGKIEGDFLIFRAEYAFSTEQPRTSIVLGLQGGHLLDEGMLNEQAPILDYTEDGFVARVDKEGSHQLVLNFRVPIQVRKTTGGAVERGIELGLPGLAVTLLNLELPATVTELRCNDTLEKADAPGRWQIGLEKAKSLNLSWKDPLPLTAGTPLAKVDAQIQVRIDETYVNIAADLYLDALRAQAKEWQLLLPAQAEVTEVKKPSGEAHAWAKPDAKSPYYRIMGVTPGKWQVSITQRVMKPGPGERVPIGPFHVQGAFQQNGTIWVQMPGDVGAGQRLIYTRTGLIFQVKNADAEAEFRYLIPLDKAAKAGQPLKAPLEIELRTDRTQLESQVEHSLRLKGVLQNWELESTTRIQYKAIHSTISSVELKLPVPRPRGAGVIGDFAPGSAFPGAVPWGTLWRIGNSPASTGLDEFSVHDEQGNPLRLTPLDGMGRTRVNLERAPAKLITLILKNTLSLPAEQQRLRLELARPLNTLDRGVQLGIQSDERIELLHGPVGAEVPVPDRHRFDLRWEQSPSAIDLAWRPHEPEVIGTATMDITLHEESAQVRQVLQFQGNQRAAGGDPRNAQISFKLPHGIERITAISGGEITNQDLSRRILAVRLQAGAQEKIELVLEYDLSLAKKQFGEQGPRSLAVAQMWPTHVAQKDLKVRVWTSAGITARLSDDPQARGIWRERSVELVKDKARFPSLVLQGFGANLPLTLKLEESSIAPAAVFIADRALLALRLGEDDSQHYRARYLLRKIQGAYVDVELPLPLSRLRDATFVLGKYSLTPEKLDPSEKAIRLKLHPELAGLPAVLEIGYTIPHDAADHSFWRTALHVPHFRSNVLVGQIRAQFSAPAPVMTASLGRKVRPDLSWGMQGWLLAPEPALTVGDLDAWLFGKDAAPTEEQVTYSFALATLQPEPLYHLARHWWLLGCSSVFLILTMAAFFMPLSRAWFWFFLVLIGLGILMLGVLAPAALPPLIFGAQPGIVLFGGFLGVHWLMQERYRRQLVFLPGFVRAKSSSTIVRTNAARIPRDTSTVDAPLEAAADGTLKPPASSVGP